MEFDDVVLIDFFSGLPSKVQEWWKKRFQNSALKPAAETQVHTENESEITLVLVTLVFQLSSHLLV